MEFTGCSLAEATDRVVHSDIAGRGAGGGVIAVDATGTIAMPFNTAGMFRGRVTDKEAPWVAIWP